LRRNNKKLSKKNKELKLGLHPKCRNSILLQIINNKDFHKINQLRFKIVN